MDSLSINITLTLGMYYLVTGDMFRPTLRHLQVGCKETNVFRNETCLHNTRFKDCSDWSHLIPSSLSSTLTASSFPLRTQPNSLSVTSELCGIRAVKNASITNFEVLFTTTHARFRTREVVS